MLVINKSNVKVFNNTNRNKRIPQSMKALRAVHNDSVLFEYLDTYAKYVCKYEKTNDCLDKMIVPPPEQQLSIINSLMEISGKHDIKDLEGVIFKLLILKDEHAIDTLLNAASVHNQSLDVIQSIIDYAFSLPIDLIHS